MDLAAAHGAARRLVDNVETVIRGKRGSVEAAAITLFAGGHLLIEDVPGVGKTMLARSVARSIRASFKRVQATADLLPSDITGSSVYDRSESRFEFMPGPLFANVVLVDEVNRMTPRAQSALLEAMDEGAVTVDGRRHGLPQPFFVVATQNPVEHHGTYPLPEGQLDRFALTVGMGYLSATLERDVIKSQLEAHPIEDLDAVLETDEVEAVRGVTRSIHVSESVLGYALALVQATRDSDELELGASPRGTITLVRCAQARALVLGRDYVVPDDIKALAGPVLAHRVVPAGPGLGHRSELDALIHRIVQATPVPVFKGTPPPPAK
jgi:MoxR-like ATPase